MNSRGNLLSSPADRLAYVGALLGVASLSACGNHDPRQIIPNPDKPHVVHITEGLSARENPDGLNIFTHKAMEKFLHEHGRSKVEVFSMHGNQYVSVQYGQGIASANAGFNAKGDIALNCVPPRGKADCELRVERTDIGLDNKAHKSTHLIEVPASP